MKVLIIPEDPTNDSFIIKPVIEAVFADLGRRARIDMLRDPQLRGTNDALDRAMVARIIDENPMEDLFLLVVDRDCNRNGTETKAAARAAAHAGKLLACVAKQEVEVWMLALHADKIVESFREVRDECDPKERFAEPLLDRLGVRGGPGAGRKAARRPLAGNMRSLLSRCDELADLRAQIDAWWQARQR